MNDRFLSMQLFVRVARTGSFSLAGRELGVSQPSASRIVASLERRIGVPLLTRTTRGVKLTDAGAAYLTRAEDILAALEGADQAARGTGEFRGVLRIACSSTFATRSVLPSLSPFADAHPKLRLTFLLDDHLHDLIAEGVDVAFRMGAPPNPDAVARRIGSNQRLLVAAPCYLTRAGTPRTPDELSKHTLIAGPAGLGPEGWTFRHSGRTLANRVEARYVFDSTEAATAAAVNGLGILSTGHLACLAELRGGTLVKVLPDWDMGSVDVHLVLPAGRTSKPSARAFADFIGAVFSNQKNCTGND